MIRYTTEQLATITALPTITILLIWTVAIFHKNRDKWGPYDIPIVSVLVLSILRNASVLSYLLINTLSDPSSCSLEYCSVIVWTFNSIHTFQASSLTTIAVIGLFSVKLHRKQQNLKQFLTPTHIIYHLFCLTTLCACVGVAAVLGQREEDIHSARAAAYFQCKFMPFNLDVKFNVFILVLHTFLSVVAFASFLIICFDFYRTKTGHFEYMKKSNSDLSDLSLGNTLNTDLAKNYYDTYTIQRGNQNLEGSSSFYDAASHQNHLQNGFCRNRDVNWNSDLSNLSTTVSSTNSKRPCLGQNVRVKEGIEEKRTGLETIHPVLIVCYLFYHLPLIILCIYPNLVQPWPVSGIALWLGLIQDLLIPVGLGIVDSRFCRWVSSVYRCSGKSVEEKLPHVGLDGKFRPFGTVSQPQSLETTDSERTRALQVVEHRFPITNGSLYTSIDGRLPVIHNYRRNRDNKGTKQQEKQPPTVAFLSPPLSQRPDFIDHPSKFPSCSNCEADLCPSHSNLHHLSPHYVNKQLSFLQHNHNLLLAKRSTPDMRMAHSQESLNYMPEMQNGPLFCRNSDLALNGITNMRKSSRNLARLNRMRLSRSEDSLNELHVKELGDIINLTRQKTVEANRAPQPPQKRPKTFTRAEVNSRNDYSSSDDDYPTDTNNNNDHQLDSMSLRSCCSITTEANCDFDFFQNNDRASTERPSSIDTIESSNEFFVIHNVNNRPVMTSFKPVPPPRNSSQTDLNKNFRITRSNSKRSLENFQAFLEVEQENLDSKHGLKRSNSFMTLEDRCKGRCKENIFTCDTKFSDCSHQISNFRPKIKSVEYLPNTNTSTVFIEDANSDIFFRGDILNSNNKFMNSVPDLQRVFISEYI